MGNAAKARRENRTSTVDFQNESPYLELLHDDKAFVEFILAFILSIGLQRHHKASGNGGSRCWSSVTCRCRRISWLMRNTAGASRTGFICPRLSVAVSSGIWVTVSPRALRRSPSPMVSFNALPLSMMPAMSTVLDQAHNAIDRKLFAMKGFHHPGGHQAAFLNGLVHLYNLILYQRRALNAGKGGVEVEGGRVPTSDWMLNLQILISGGYQYVPEPPHH